MEISEILWHVIPPTLFQTTRISVAASKCYLLLHFIKIYKLFQDSGMYISKNCARVKATWIFRLYVNNY
jgi:hypothetical protein